MAKLKKVKQYHFGIEITKPHSKEMYDHNNEVAYEMKSIIKAEINEAHMRAIGTLAASGGMDKGEKDLRKIVKAFTGYSFGDGYDLDDIKEEGLNILTNTENWSLHEEYSYLCHEGIVPKLKQGMVGHKLPFFVYYTDEIMNGRCYINTIETIAKDRLRWTSCSDSDGNLWKEPYIKCDSKQEAESLEFPLRCNGVDAYVDCYEDDDGEGDDGRPIIRELYSVRIKNY